MPTILRTQHGSSRCVDIKPRRGKLRGELQVAGCSGPMVLPPGQRTGCSGPVRVRRPEADRRVACASSCVLTLYTFLFPLPPLLHTLFTHTTHPHILSLTRIATSRGGTSTGGPGSSKLGPSRRLLSLSLSIHTLSSTPHTLHTHTLLLSSSLLLFLPLPASSPSLSSSYFFFKTKNCRSPVCSCVSSWLCLCVACWRTRKLFEA